jgi:hypothetical protein
VIVFSLVISTLFYDYSWDGQTYHQEAIFYLKNGWNPIYEHHASNASHEIWLSHYAKGLETISATIYSTTSNIETGKAVNFILVFASAFLFFSFLKTCYEILSLKKKILLTLIFVLCPVVTAQILTYYIDWAAYSLLLILVPSIVIFLKEHSKYNLFVIASVVFLAATIKFNIFFWILFVLFIYLIYIFYCKEYQLFKKIIIICIISSVFAVCVAAFNPYITNIIDHKNPFYPLMGEGKIDIMTDNTPLVLLEKSRLESVFISLFLLPDMPTIGYQDARIGGFGIFFSSILVLSIILYCAISFCENRGFKNKYRIKYDIFLLILFLSLFILPYAWWARYFPFFYAFPLIMLLYSEQEKKNRQLNILRRLVYFLLIANIIFMCSSSFYRAIAHKVKVDNVITLLIESKEPVLINLNSSKNVAFKIKLDNNQIKYIESSEQLGLEFVLIPDIFLDSAKYGFDKKYSILGKNISDILVKKENN